MDAWETGAQALRLTDSYLRQGDVFGCFSLFVVMSHLVGDLHSLNALVVALYQGLSQ